jgi:glutaredoxin
VNQAVGNLSVYEYEACPFCIKVRRFMKASGISLPLRDAKKDPHKNELLQGGGKLQVPCLRVEKEDGSVQWMYESNEIITFLKSKTSA